MRFGDLHKSAFVPLSGETIAADNYPRPARMQIEIIIGFAPRFDWSVECIMLWYFAETNGPDNNNNDANIDSVIGSVVGGAQ